MAVADIEIRIDTLQQLFDALDPAPFRAKTLDRDAEAYLLDCAGEHAAKDRLRLVVHGPPALGAHGDEIADAVHAHFALMAMQAERRWHMRVRRSRVVVLVGIVTLAVALVARELLAASPVPGTELLNEGLLILGWVALWRPIEQGLFDRFEHRAQHRMLRRLATIAIDVRGTPADQSARTR